METLPAWLQWLVALATVLSSVGVIIALVQLRISGEQFNKQLKLTEGQFKLLNQGYIDLKFNQQLYERGEDNKIYPSTEVTDDKQYFATALAATLKNVGNMPIWLDMKHCIVYADGKEIYRTPEEIFKLTQNAIYPTSEMPYNFGMFSLGETGLNLQQLFTMNLTYDLLIEYADFSDKGHIKRISRLMALEGGQILIRRNDDFI